MAATTTMQNGYTRHASGSFSSNGSANMTGGSARGDSDVREAMHASLRVLQQFKESQAKLQNRVNTLEVEVGQMHELREKNRVLEGRLSEVQGLFESVVKRLEKVEAASATASAANQLVETAATKLQANGHQILHSPSLTRTHHHTARESPKALRPEASIPPPNAPQGISNGVSQDMSRDSSQSSGKRVSFAGVAGAPVLDLNSAQAPDGEFDLLGGTSMKRKPVVNGVNGSVKPEDHSLLDGLDFHPGSAPEVIADAAQASSPDSTSRSAQSASHARVYEKLTAELAESRHLIEQASHRERRLKSEIEFLKGQLVPASDQLLSEREAALREKEGLLRTDALRYKDIRLELEEREAEQDERETKLAERGRQLSEREAVCADHEIELERRLKVVQKREQKADDEDGMRDMRRRLPTHDAREAEQWRRHQELKALKEDYHRRLRELEAAEKDWCTKTGHLYVPVIPQPKKE